MTSSSSSIDPEWVQLRLEGKVRICNFFGKCSRGPKCSFAHVQRKSIDQHNGVICRDQEKCAFHGLRLQDCSCMFSHEKEKKVESIVIVEEKKKIVSNNNEPSALHPDLEENNKGPRLRLAQTSTGYQICTTIDDHIIATLNVTRPMLEEFAHDLKMAFGF